MIRNKYDVVERPNMRDGEGTVTINGWLAEAEKPKNLRLAATLVLPEGASIGEHVHEGEAEVFHVASGAGVYFDDGKANAVKAGDIMLCANGHRHGVKNTGCGDLVINAVIINE